MAVWLASSAFLILPRPSRLPWSVNAARLQAALFISRVRPDRSRARRLRGHVGVLWVCCGGSQDGVGLLWGCCGGAVGSPGGPGRDWIVGVPGGSKRPHHRTARPADIKAAVLATPPSGGRRCLLATGTVLPERPVVSRSTLAASCRRRWSRMSASHGGATPAVVSVRRRATRRPHRGRHVAEPAPCASKGSVEVNTVTALLMAWPAPARRH